MGKGITIDGVTVMARGYEPLWTSSLWHVEPGAKPIALTRSSDPSQDEQTLGLLERQEITGSEAMIFGYCGGQIEVRFDTAASSLIHDFFS